MGDTDRVEPALRVERGHATDEELAALTVVLLALGGEAAEAEDEETRPVDGTRWWRGPDAYRTPRSWR
jgi:hypothetical protein